ncbi:MAG: SGNH/GDSL hydrolase family protein [Actinomycetota bacterium]|nr:SGNH/GDSL hydrolase family protein [Actinomycetota bacterium]
MTRTMRERLGEWLRHSHSGAPRWLLVLAMVVVIGAGGLFGVRALAAGSPGPTRPAHLVAAFIGDSYTQGVGASAPAGRWTTRVSVAAGWREVNLGRGGTGYVATSGVSGCGLPFCPNYQQMVQRAINADPDIVVVSGGQNDFGAWQTDASAERTAINDVFERLRQALPSARIYAIGPSTTGGVGGPVVGIDAAVQAAARHTRATYVSLIAPDVIVPGMVLSDGGHVDDAGHAAIAQRVLHAIRAAPAG